MLYVAPAVIVLALKDCVMSRGSLITLKSAVTPCDTKL